MQSYKGLGISFFGPASYLKAPIVSLDGDWRADIAALGIPFDQGTGFRSGARWGPRGIRNMSVRFSSVSSADAPGFWDLRSGKDKALCSFVDCGDVDIVPLMWEDNFDRITRSVQQILEHEALPFVFGGDHAISYPVVRAFEGRGPITVVHFDAHMDYRDEAMGVRYGHGNVLRRIRELPWIDKIVAIGIRSSRTRKEDYEDSIAAGNVIIPAWEVHSALFAELEQRLPADRDIYITFDIDGMDAAIAPGTGTPEVGGLNYEQARAILECLCRRNRVVGVDLVELNPSLDPQEITALLANQLLLDIAGFLYSR